MSERADALGESVDRLITADLAFRGVVHLLYPPARRRAERPLALAAADLLRSRTVRGDVVVLATGWPDRPWVSDRIFETDGPPGAAALARCLNLAFGAVPVVAVEPDLVPAMERVLRGAGLVPLPVAEARKAAKSDHAIHAASVLPWPSSVDEARERSREVLADLHPAAVVAIEKGSMNRLGRIHTRKGHDVTDPIAKVDPLVEAARANDVLTIGIGDGGNEVGMGNIRDDVRRSIPFGDACACPCQGGIAPEGEVDALVVASVSNWGAYGVEACTAFLVDLPEAMHDAALERLTLEASADAGLMDGITGHVEPSVDGLREDVHVAVVSLLNALVRSAGRNVW